jgi:hypothetical protein
LGRFIKEDNRIKVRGELKEMLNVFFTGENGIDGFELMGGGKPIVNHTFSRNTAQVEKEDGDARTRHG